MTQLHLSRIFLLLSLWLTPNLIKAQKLDTLNVMFNQGEVIPLPYILVENEREMEKAKLTKQTYPVAILPKEIFMEAYYISLKRTERFATLEKEIDFWQKKDSLSKEETKILNGLVDAYKKQLAACDTLNGQLNSSILTMNNNFNGAMALVEKPIKLGLIKKAGIGLLGGAIGFSLATLLGAFK